MSAGFSFACALRVCAVPPVPARVRVETCGCGADLLVRELAEVVSSQDLAGERGHAVRLTDGLI